jgi:hypothetical protein
MDNAETVPTIVDELIPISTVTWYILQSVIAL